MWLSYFHLIISYPWNIIHLVNENAFKVYVLDVNLLRGIETLPPAQWEISRIPGGYMVLCQWRANYSCLLLNRHCLFFFLSFVPDTSAGSFCSLPASEISNRKQNATLRSEARGGHLWAGNVYDCYPSTFCGRLFLNYMCARANCGWWSGTNSKINEPHSELYSLWRWPYLSQCVCRAEMPPLFMQGARPCDREKLISRVDSQNFSCYS